MILAHNDSDCGRRAYEVAKQGGKHHEFWKQYLNKSEKELKKGIRSFQRRIDEHKAKIANPESIIPNFKELDPRHQSALLRGWEDDIVRQTEQMGILEGILRDRVQ